MSIMKKIFISIASYRDSQLEYTVEDILQKAKYPDRLVFGICQQDTEQEIICFRERFSSLDSTQMKVIAKDFRESRGCCWARSLIQGLISDEEFYLQIDAHHRFVKDWDVLCEEMLESCKMRSGKPILSTYATPCVLDGASMRITHGDVPFLM